MPILFSHLEFRAIWFVRYDGHVLDPLANLQYTTGTYYMLASSIKQLAKDLCGGRCVFFLEGGYNLKSLSYSVADTFRALLGDRTLASEFDDPNILYEEPTKKVKQAIQRIKHVHSLWCWKSKPVTHGKHLSFIKFFTFCGFHPQYVSIYQIEKANPLYRIAYGPSTGTPIIIKMPCSHINWSCGRNYTKLYQSKRRDVMDYV